MTTEHHFQEDIEPLMANNRMAIKKKGKVLKASFMPSACKQEVQDFEISYCRKRIQK